MKLSRDTRLPAFYNSVVYAFVAHITFVLLYLITIPLNPFLFKTPFGFTSVAVFGAIAENWLMVATIRRLGVLQAIGVIATSFSLSVALNPNAYGTIWASLSDVSVVFTAALVFYLTKNRMKLLNSYMLAMALGCVSDLFVYAMGSGIPQIILPSLYVEGLFTAMLICIAMALNLINPRRDQDAHNGG